MTTRTKAATSTPTPAADSSAGRPPSNATKAAFDVADLDVLPLGAGQRHCIFFTTCSAKKCEAGVVLATVRVHEPAMYRYEDESTVYTSPFSLPCWAYNFHDLTCLRRVMNDAKPTEKQRYCDVDD